LTGEGLPAQSYEAQGPPGTGSDCEQECDTIDVAVDLIELVGCSLIGLITIIGGIACGIVGLGSDYAAEALCQVHCPQKKRSGRNWGDVQCSSSACVFNAFFRRRGESVNYVSILGNWVMAGGSASSHGYADAYYNGGDPFGRNEFRIQGYVIVPDPQCFYRQNTFAVQIWIELRWTDGTWSRLRTQFQKPVDAVC
jgi:hypothetical protein